MYRVMRSAPSCIDPPCPCSEPDPHEVWRGESLAGYAGGIGAFDEGCHHPSRWAEQMVDGQWVPVEVERDDAQGWRERPRRPGSSSSPAPAPLTLR